MTLRLKMLKPADQMDLWLDAQGYYRKHTARDASCLFRAVSEQLFLTQVFHMEVRRQCIQFGFMYKGFFQKMTDNKIKDCLDRLRSSSEGGGSLELKIMSLMYRCDFILFREIGKAATFETNNGYDKKVTLCLSQEKHYDSVYSKEHITNAAFCQSLIYEKLYKDVFGLLEVDYAVKKMLSDKSSRYQRDQSSFLPNGMALRLELRDNCTNVKELLTLGVTPFPYKVAKSLNSEIYRNVEFDTWNEYRKGLRYAGRIWSNHELIPGVKCLVKLQEGKTFHAFIQEMEPNKGPVLVFIEEMGEKLTVPYESLELMPQVTQPQVNTFTPLQHFRQLQKNDASSTNLQPDSSQMAKKNMKGNVKVKSKDGPGGEIRIRRNSAHADSSSQNMATSVPIVSSSDSYQQNSDYQHSTYDCYQNQNYITQSSEVTSTMPETEEMMKMDTFCQSHVADTSQSPSNGSFNLNVMHDANNNFTTTPVCNMSNVVPNKSVLPDGSDLPLSDISTLRYFYNLGLDYYLRMNCVVRPNMPATTFYPVVQPVVPQYLPDNHHISYVNVSNEQHYQPSMKPPQQNTAESVPSVTAVLHDIVPSPSDVSVNNESESSSNASGVQHQIAPRFKNRRKLMLKNCNNSNANNDLSNSNNKNSDNGNSISNSCEVTNNQCSNNGNQQNVSNKFAGAPIMRQPETPSHITPVTFPPNVPPSTLPPVPVIPPVLPPHHPTLLHTIPQPPQPSNHYLPVPPPYSPPATQAFYYQPFECESYCPVSMNSYYECSIFEHTGTAVYPTVVVQPQQPTQFASSPYLTADCNIYY